jgi:hypothetical protein
MAALSLDLLPPSQRLHGGTFSFFKSNKGYNRTEDGMKILCLDHNRPLRPRACKEEEEEDLHFSQTYVSVLHYYMSEHVALTFSL